MSLQRTFGELGGKNGVWRRKGMKMGTVMLTRVNMMVLMAGELLRHGETRHGGLVRRHVAQRPKTRKHG
jgi:hypothetical protein